MVRDEYSIRRLLSAISKPQLWAQGRLACMSCVSLFGAFKRQHHCRHCGRLICGSCSTGVLDITYFPPLFAMETGSASLRVCAVCEDILTSRRKRTRAAFPWLSRIRSRQYHEINVATILSLLSYYHYLLQEHTRLMRNFTLFYFCPAKEQMYVEASKARKKHRAYACVVIVHYGNSLQHFNGRNV